MDSDCGGECVTEPDLSPNVSRFLPDTWFETLRAKGSGAPRFWASHIICQGFGLNPVWATTPPPPVAREDIQQWSDTGVCICMSFRVPVWGCPGTPNETLN